MGKAITASSMQGRLPIGAVVAIFAYGGFASLFAPYTRSAQIVTVIPCLAIVALAIGRGWHRRHVQVEAPGGGPRWKSGLAAWVTLLALAVLFLLLNFSEWPRTTYPTLSWMASQVFGIPGVRAMTFGLWLWFGWYLVDR